ncbi:tRNA pseudouridine(13) synthase TruD [Methanothermococcus thermolithotrophicus]|jgi:tRNA pseudouridine13 synthase|uniref:tRNA pseudouridine(13) synthase TruD n=1 Tax=Methanothermococcus thermolithotrophicus TaxID=2186 RepID=UPI00038101A6|nr:tRNA pseudouridine(13) synthase TruD [Methanothermococcus thermolithotrophicus]
MKFRFIQKKRKEESQNNLRNSRERLKLKFRRHKIYSLIDSMPPNLNKYVLNLKHGHLNGTIKKHPEDFIVEEITEDGIVLEVGKDIGFKDVEKWNGSFIQFTLEKNNWNTMDAIGKIARATKSRRKNFGFAGTKDKFAITTQKVGCFGIKMEDLKKVNIPGITLRDIHKSNKKLRMGHLWGNRFTIKVRDVECSREELENTLKNIKIEYVLNYYGIQRFGHYRPITHVVGKFIYQRDFESAFYTYCGTPINEEGILKEARELVDNGEFKKALELYPKRQNYERRMLEYYLRYKDFKKAFKALPPQLNSMFVNAYQSYLFNEMINKRYEYGFEPMEGDILKDGVPTGVLYGYNTKFADGIQGEIEKEIAERENLDLKKFRIEDFGNFQGARRKLIAKVYDFDCKIDDDGYVLKFKLRKGNYATAVLREFIEKLE